MTDAPLSAPRIDLQDVRLVVLEPAVAPKLAVPPVTGDVQATADSVRYDVGTGAIVLEGNAMVRRGAVVLRAASARYDPTATSAFR